MSGKNRKKKGSSNKNSTNWMKVCVIFSFVFAAIVLCYSTFVRGDKNTIQAQDSEYERKKAALFIHDPAPREFVLKHIWISENAHLGPKSEYFAPAHVLFRTNEASEWSFVGSGTLLLKNDGYMVSAQHVFEKKVGQYGYRLIGLEELDGSRKVSPVLSCVGSGVDDSVMCKVGTETDSFVQVSLENKNDYFKIFNRNLEYEFKPYPAKIRMLDYPESRVIDGIFSLTDERGSTFVLFQCEDGVVPGESGSGAIVDSHDPKTLLVIVGHLEYGALPIEIQRQIKPNRPLVKGLLVKIGEN